MREGFRGIELFVAAYEERSFTAAAKRENATQSGVSQHIRKLEDQLGTQLFFRDKGAISPTPAGNAYYERCVELLSLAEVAHRVGSQFGKGVTGEIFVGLMPTLTSSALAPALARFTRDHPNVTARIIEAYSAVLTQQVLAGSLNFAVVPAISKIAGIKSRHFQRTIEVLVSRPDGELKHLAPVILRDLPPLKLLVPGLQNTRRRSIELHLATNGVRIEQMLELDAMLGTLDFVARSDWVTILPGTMMASDIERRSVTVNPIVDPVFPLDLVQIEPSRGAISVAAKVFLDILKEEAQRLDTRWEPYLSRLSA